VKRLLVATTNPGKQSEFRRLLRPLAAEMVTPGEIGLDLEIDEPYDTYLENAVAKAATFAGSSGLVSVADDSGIEVAALDWGPGVRSARWAGDRGREAGRLLEALEGTADRRARMVCALAVATPRPDGEPLVETFIGVIEGTIASERHGSGGFGYDPVFLIDGQTTTAELPDAEKDRISHRGRAVAAALPRLRELLDEH
jgi:XTP/dITP diphosphohydrolase